MTLKFTVQKEIFDIDLEDKKILLDSNSGRYIELNSTAAKIFEFVNVYTDGADTVIATVQNGNENYQDVVRLDGTATTIDELVDLTAGNNFLA